MPDISKLSDLSEILEVSIDQILGNEYAGGILRSIQCRDETVTPEELIEAAPILKPQQINSMFEKMKDQMDWDALAAMAPFLDDEISVSYTHLDVYKRQITM